MLQISRGVGGTNETVIEKSQCAKENLYIDSISSPKVRLWVFKHIQIWDI